MDEARYPSPAKINLGLRILGKRADGYHSIETILHALDLYDWLSFRRTEDEGIRLSCSNPVLPTDERNLVTRAAGALQRAGHVRQGVEIHLDKRIPLAAGLGGGSSNAATTLLALNRLWGLQWDVTALHREAVQLGSDVPFFLGGPAALARGRGEELVPLPPGPPLRGVLVNPGFGVSAGWAYSQFDGRSHATGDSMARITAALARHELTALAAAVVNDLEPGVARTHPVIGEMREALRAAGASVVFMSGSGPTLCGLFRDSAEAWRGASRLRERPPWAVMPFSTLSYSPLVERQG